jgi:hypothetical protein
MMMGNRITESHVLYSSFESFLSGSCPSLIYLGDDAVLALVGSRTISDVPVVAV